MLLSRSWVSSRLGCRNCTFSSILSFGNKQQTKTEDADAKGNHKVSELRKHAKGTKPEETEEFKTQRFQVGRQNRGRDRDADSRDLELERGRGVEVDSAGWDRKREPYYGRGGGSTGLNTFDGEWEPGKNRTKYRKNTVYDGNADRDRDRERQLNGKFRSYRDNYNYGNDRPKKYGKASFGVQDRRSVQDSEYMLSDQPRAERSSSAKWQRREGQGSPYPADSHSRPPRWSEAPSTPGKRVRKKQKQGALTAGEDQASADADQLLYGLHPVQLALNAGHRSVIRVYHRQDAGHRLSALLEQCSARGIAAVPLPVMQLDTLAQGTGVHQGVLARVTPLPVRPVTELLTQLGYPPLQAEAADQQGTAQTSGDPDVEAVLPAEHHAAVKISGQASGDVPNQTSDHAAAVRSITSEESQDKCFSKVEERLSGNTSSGGADIPRTAESDIAQVSHMSGPPMRTESISVASSDSGDSQSVCTPSVNAPAAAEGRQRRVWLLLDRIQDPMNLGSILRSSYFLGVDAVLLPDRNSCALSPTVSKASAGVLEVFPVYTVPADSCRQLLQLLSSRSWQLLAAGARGDAGGCRAEGVCPASDTLLVVGNEGRGVSPELAELCTQLTIPPQRHLVDGVESLNVGVATGILLSQVILNHAVGPAR